MTVLPAPLSIRQPLLASKGEVLAVARRYGDSNQRLFGSVALGLEHDGSDLDLLVD
jgi:predicted nucleotidyltransferase